MFFATRLKSVQFWNQCWIQMTQWDSIPALGGSEAQQSWPGAVTVNSHQWLSQPMPEVPAWQQSRAAANTRNVLADFTDQIFLVSCPCRKHLLQRWPCVVAQPFGQQWISNPAHVTDRRPPDAAGADSFWGRYFPTGTAPATTALTATSWA